jgi:hypothetical protein
VALDRVLRAYGKSDPEARKELWNREGNVLDIAVTEGLGAYAEMVGNEVLQAQRFGDSPRALEDSFEAIHQGEEPVKGSTKEQFTGPLPWQEIIEEGFKLQRLPFAVSKAARRDTISGSIQTGVITQISTGLASWSGKNNRKPLGAILFQGDLNDSNPQITGAFVAYKNEESKAPDFYVIHAGGGEGEMPVSCIKFTSKANFEQYFSEEKYSVMGVTIKPAGTLRREDMEEEKKE